MHIHTVLLLLHTHFTTLITLCNSFSLHLLHSHLIELRVYVSHFWTSQRAIQHWLLCQHAWQRLDSFDSCTLLSTVCALIFAGFIFHRFSIFTYIALLNLQILAIVPYPVMPKFSQTKLLRMAANLWKLWTLNPTKIKAHTVIRSKWKKCAPNQWKGQQSISEHFITTVIFAKIVIHWWRCPKWHRSIWTFWLVCTNLNHEQKS